MRSLARSWRVSARAAVKRVALAIAVVLALSGLYVGSWVPVTFVCDKLEINGTPIGRAVDKTYAPLVRLFWADYPNDQHRN